MRLTETQIQAIHAAAKELFGSDARVSLFGSRVDDQQRGGDIDLLIEIDHVLDIRQSNRVSIGTDLKRKFYLWSLEYNA